MIRVVNKRKHRGAGVYVGRPTPLGNPFSHMPGTIAQHQVESRDAAIERYRRWLAEELAANPAGPAAEMLARLVNAYRSEGELTLVCWCAPQACHADVIADAVRERAEAADAPR